MWRGLRARRYGGDGKARHLRVGIYHGVRLDTLDASGVNLFELRRRLPGDRPHVPNGNGKGWEL
jgi:hypothetical protein